MDGKEPITESKDILEALDTIRSIEMMGYALEGKEFHLKWSKAVFHCMDILRNIHDDLVSRLPKDVVEVERAKAAPAQSNGKPPAEIIRP